MGLEFDLSDEDIKVFLDEAEELLQLLDEDILKLEHDGTDDVVLQDIFRAAHTLKGSSATLGHARMSEMTHHMENIFDKLRSNEIQITPDLIDSLLEALDALKAFKEEIETKEESTNDYTPLVDKLSSFVGEDVVEESPREAEDDNEESLEELITFEEVKGNQILEIKLKLTSDCAMPAVRIFQAYEEIRNSCKILSCSPTDEELTSGETSLTATILVSTQETEHNINTSLNAIPDIFEIEISNYQSETNGVQVESQKEKQSREIVTDQVVNAKVSEKEIKQSDKGTRTVRVDVERLDMLMNLVGELVISRTQLEQIGDGLKSLEDISDEVKGLIEVTLHIGRITSDLQEEIVKARMLPIERVFNKFPRMIRDLAKKCNKEVEFTISGKETELDRSVIEEIGDPLIHILRNAIDHGVESPDERIKIGKPAIAEISLAARHQEGQIVIEVEDDGRGIDCQTLRNKAVDSGLIGQEVASRMSDHEAVQLIFNSGISTAKQVTHLSGRGVGMDIVRTNIEKLNGTVEVFTELGKGSKFTIKLPLTLAIIQALLTSVAGRVFAIPLNLIVETIRLEPELVKFVNQRETLIVRGSVLPLLRLNSVFGISQNGNDRYFVVIVSFGGSKIGFVVDSLVGEQEIVVKSLGNYICNIKGISGATILGDGRVALIVDAPSMVEAFVREQNMVAV